MIEGLGPLLGGLFGQRRKQTASPMDVPVPGRGGPLDRLKTQGMGQATPADADSDIENDITVTGWKPKKRTTLGAIADALLIYKGKAPAFAERAKRQNVEAAMEGFTSDPLESIRKMRQVDPEAAWKMHGQYLDDVRADEAAARQRSVVEEAARDRIGAMLGAANEENYGELLPVIRRYAASKGLDPSEISNTYDPDGAALWRMGGMTVDQQEDNNRDEGYDERRLRQYDRGLASTEAYRSERLEDMDADRADKNERARLQRESVQGRFNAKQDSKNPPSVQIKDSKGNTRSVRFNADKTRAVSDLPNGQQIRYRVEGGKLIVDHVK